MYQRGRKVALPHLTKVIPDPAGKVRVEGVEEIFHGCSKNKERSYPPPLPSQSDFPSPSLAKVVPDPAGVVHVEGVEEEDARPRFVAAVATAAVQVHVVVGVVVIVRHFLQKIKGGGRGERES